MATIGQDLRYAIRRLKDTPLLSVAAILTLALGLGVNSAVLRDPSSRIFCMA